MSEKQPPKEIRKITLYRFFYNDTVTAPVVAESHKTVSVLFFKQQFPNEWYVLDYDLTSGECTDKRYRCEKLYKPCEQTELFS